MTPGEGPHPEPPPVLLIRSDVHRGTWVAAWGGDDTLDSFSNAGPLRTVKRHAEQRWGVTRWTRDDDDWQGWVK